jgi:diguanylate cyclase (GGDEF)-like protein/PAS domain S-box-containing protein
MDDTSPNDTNRPLLSLVLAATAALACAGLCAAFVMWRVQWLRQLKLVDTGAVDVQRAATALNGATAGMAAAFLVFCFALVFLWRRAKTAPGDSRYRAVVEQAPNGVLTVDAQTFRILDANPAQQRSSGFTLDELRALSLGQLFVDETTTTEAMLIKLRDPGPLPFQIRQRCRDGSLLEVEVTGHSLEIDGQPVLAFTTCDVTVRRKIEAQLLEKQQHLDHLAHHDQLTGLPNRLYLAAHLPGAIEEARRKGTMLAVLFLDLDRFKHINDSRGHETGDKLLKTVAQRVRATVRDNDVVVRMGGDEFIVILKAVRDAKLINELASRINEALSAPVIVDGRPLVTTVSIGVSLYPRDGVDMGELLRHSDTAMYQAKDRGRNNFQLFSPVMDRKLKERVAIETSLRAAIQLNQFDVHYQPIVDIVSSQVVGLEALLRWKHPSQGYVRPSRFISVAEETGLIVPIGEFVLQRVFEDMTRWRHAGAKPVPVGVNISAVQLQRSNLCQRILELTREHGIDAQMLQLELTESAMFERGESRAGESRQDTISQLRELGVRMAIDDFGTGYSSLSYLKRWRVDYLKIDRSFVRDLVTDMSDLAIVGAIIAIARHLNIQVVAEGIESFQQLEKLRHLGCGFAQGYLFARPMPATQCKRLLHLGPLNVASDEDTFTGTFEATGSDG